MKRQTNKWTSWSEAEDARLDELRASGLVWEVIGERMPGRTQQACRQRYSLRHGKPSVRPAAAPAPAAAPRQAPLAPVLAVLQEAEARSFGRRISTATLLADAELRARIATKGLTAGLLGDPPPGRSALDERNGGGKGGGNG